MKTALFPVVAALALAVIPVTSQAAPLLSVDFNADNNINTQAGFQGFALAQGGGSGGVYTNTYGNFTVNVAGDDSVDANGVLNSTGSGPDGVLSRDKGVLGSGFTYSNLYRDFAFGGNTGADSFAFQIYGPGLSANTAYNVTFYAYDNDNSGTSTFTNRTGLNTGDAGTTLGTITWTGGSTFNSSTPESIFSLTSTVTSDANGRLTFGVGASGVKGKINGFEISAVPEPGTWALLAFSLTAVIVLRRRQIS
ncbi:MAG: PEP-CTERM sorting domain-containing protein [Terrimicrobiaceae bacterium]